MESTHSDQSNRVKCIVLQPDLQVDHRLGFGQLGESLDQELSTFNSVRLHAYQAGHRVQRGHVAPARCMGFWIQLRKEIGLFVLGIRRRNVPFTLDDRKSELIIGFHMDLNGVMLTLTKFVPWP